jgi:hypothetical protein
MSRLKPRPTKLGSEHRASRGAELRAAMIPAAFTGRLEPTGTDLVCDAATREVSVRRGDAARYLRDTEMP